MPLTKTEETEGKAALDAEISEPTKTGGKYPYTPFYDAVGGEKVACHTYLTPSGVAGFVRRVIKADKSGNRYQLYEHTGPETADWPDPGVWEQMGYDPFQ